MAVVLKNDLLCVTIDEPGKVYNGSRFDHTGNISQITLDGKWTFCTGEVTNGFDPRSNGRGLYNEFGISQPVGYNDCGIGQKFPKIGVGLLTRTSSKAYDFFAPYQAEPFKIHFEYDNSRIKFIVLPQDCRGYSVKLVKTVTLSENSFKIGYELENTGTKRIVTNEYCHNFIAINNSLIDANYILTVPCKTTGTSDMNEAINPEKAVELNTNTLSFRLTPKSDFFFSPLANFQTMGEWILSHEGFRIAIKESTDFIPELMNVWGTGHVVSPELFVKIDLMPGETRKWQRKYEFYHL
ncbi:MAG TPA: hypothetical protein VHI78_11315 [Bacteroidales bacterium]|jgi:hypothetical protein|nr:hypothetical protein [Bacteroidales bacterium]